MKKEELINGLIFWGAVGWSWLHYGWQLTVIILLVVITILVQKEINLRK